MKIIVHRSQCRLKHISFFTYNTKYCTGCETCPWVGEWYFVAQILLKSTVRLFQFNCHGKPWPGNQYSPSNLSQSPLFRNWAAILFSTQLSQSSKLHSKPSLGSFTLCNTLAAFQYRQNIYASIISSHHPCHSTCTAAMKDQLNCFKQRRQCISFEFSLDICLWQRQSLCRFLALGWGSEQPTKPLSTSANLDWRGVCPICRANITGRCIGLKLAQGAPAI